MAGHLSSVDIVEEDSSDEEDVPPQKDSQPQEQPHEQPQEQPMLMVPNPRRVHTVTVDRTAERVRRLHITAQRFMFAPVLQVLLQGTPVDSPHPSGQQTPLATLCASLNKTTDRSSGGGGDSARKEARRRRRQLLVGDSLAEAALEFVRLGWFAGVRMVRHAIGGGKGRGGEEYEDDGQDEDDHDHGCVACRSGQPHQHNHHYHIPGMLRPDRPATAALRVARLLLNFGADPNKVR